MHTAPTKKTITFWINAGEASGDMHGALLIQALHRQAKEYGYDFVHCTGTGGEAMAQAGFDEAFSIRELSLVGLFAIILHIPRILLLMRRLMRRLQALRPDAVILIDAPDFNFFVARMAKKLGIPVFYYVCPQVWAWRPGRVQFLKQFVNRVFCILPFEQAFLAERGLEADYTGHPVMEQIPWKELEDIPQDPCHLLLLPGSRKSEIRTLLPIFLDVARILAEKYPRLGLSLVRAPGIEHTELTAYIQESGLPVDIVPPPNRYTAMHASTLCLAASGTVTLELALIGTPTVVAYTVSRATELLGRMITPVQYISLPNLILDKEVFPECIQDKANPQTIATHALHWLENAPARKKLRQDLLLLKEKIGPAGASQRTAQHIFARLSRSL